MELGLRGRAAIVTGASRGIGRQVALDLAAEGCEVLLCGRDESTLSNVAETVRAGGGRAAVLPIDVTAPSAPEKIVAACQLELGRIDVLVNNAGATSPKPLAELSDEDWEGALELNFLAAARLSVACCTAMREARWGRLVHVASVSGRQPDPLFAPYSAAKAALINLSGALSRAFAAEGVLSNCVIPGVTLTELVEDNATATAARTGSSRDEVMARLLARHDVAAGRFGQPAEVSAAIVFLASERASWISGATLEVDGGTLRST